MQQQQSYLKYSITMKFVNVRLQESEILFT